MDGMTRRIAQAVELAVVVWVFFVEPTWRELWRG